MKDDDLSVYIYYFLIGFVVVMISVSVAYILSINPDVGDKLSRNPLLEETTTTTSLSSCEQQCLNCENNNIQCLGCEWCKKKENQKL